MGTYLNVIDNSGAKKVQCLKVLNGYKRRYAAVGDTILVSVKKLRSRRKASSRVKKGELFKAVVVRTKTKLKYFNNDNICFLNRLPQKRLKKTNQTKHDHYSSYYTEETREIVENLYKKDIELFDYHFEER